jgi:hypothetical protein
MTRRDLFRRNCFLFPFFFFKVLFLSAGNGVVGNTAYFWFTNTRPAATTQLFAAPLAGAADSAVRVGDDTYSISQLFNRVCNQPAPASTACNSDLGCQCRCKKCLFFFFFFFIFFFLLFFLLPATACGTTRCASYVNFVATVGTKPAQLFSATYQGGSIIALNPAGSSFSSLQLRLLGTPYANTDVIKCFFYLFCFLISHQNNKGAFGFVHCYNWNRSFFAS